MFCNNMNNSNTIRSVPRAHLKIVLPGYPVLKVFQDFEPLFNMVQASCKHPE